MNPVQTTGEALAPPSIHVPSLLQGVLSALALLFLWSGALLALLVGLMNIGLQGSAMGDPLAMFLMSSMLFGSGLLLLPSVYYGLNRAFGRPTVDSLPWLRHTHPALWIFALPVILLMGYAVYQQPVLSWLVLPPLHLLAVGIPVGWMLYLAVRALPLGSSQRMWGVFNSGLILGPALILVFEILAAIGFMLIAAFYVASQPELLSKITSLAATMQEAPPSPEALAQEFGDYLVRPGVMFAVLVFGAVVVPVIEELFKPIGVWLLARRRLRPAAGFAAGALSGAGYALFESLALTSGGQEWPSLMVARIGTAAVHILTTAITGWALVQAWRYRRYLLLGLTYLTAVAIHGLWNGLTIYTAFTSLAQMQTLPAELPAPTGLAMAAPVGLLLIGMTCLGALILINRRLATTLASVPSQPGLSPPSETGPESVL